MGNPFKLLSGISKKPQFVDASMVRQNLSKEDRDMLSHIGITSSMMFEKVHADIQINYDRFAVYNEVNRAISHWMIGPALELYADYATNYSSLHNASVWITSNNPTYQNILTKLLDEIGLEERIFDWAWTVAAFGDLFIKVDGMPNLGIVSINDDEHPVNLTRIDYKGCLVGFYRTPMGTAGSSDENLIPPWDFVHFRLLGAKRKRSMSNDVASTEYRNVYMLVGSDERQISSSYGSSILLNSLAAYKRLRLAEDSLLMARLTRGLIRYIWKLRVDSGNMESVNEMMTQLVGTLKKARALDTSAETPRWDSKYNPLSTVEDLLIPVWGDTGDLTYDKIGGEVDIRWIADIEELRNQLACTLRVPLSVLGGYVQEASGQLGAQAVEKLSMEFAHTARRLQRAIRNGIKRICQIHLAYLNMDPDPRLFDVHMSETSTAEEENIRDSLDKGVDVVQKMVDLAESADERADKVKIVNYLNQKILKLEDFDLNDFIDTSKPIEGENEIGAPGEMNAMNEPIETHGPEPEPESEPTNPNESKHLPIYASDLTSYLPVNKKIDGKINEKISPMFIDRSMDEWKQVTENIKIKVK